MRNVIKHRIIKIKSQPKWLVRIFVLLGTVLGGAFAFVSHPIGGTNAENIECPEGQHTEDGETCIDDEQQVPCTQTGEIPANSVYDVVNVTGTWNSGTESWDIPNCSWNCDDNYHRSGAIALFETTVSGYTITHYDNDIRYILNEGTPTERLFTGVGTFTITNGTNTITILDRNLGADIAGTGEESYGYYFKWGNNYGFSSNDSGSDIIGGTWGPCPDGFHVPSSPELSNLTTMMGYDGTHNSTNSLLAIDRLINYLLFPLAGQRDYPQVSVVHIGEVGNYYSSTTTIYQHLTYHPRMYFTLNSINPDASSTVSEHFDLGYSLRCFANSPITPGPISCAQNQQTGACAAKGVANAIYNAADVTWTWNTGDYKRDIPRCDWYCQAGYHTGVDNNSCESNTIITGCAETGEIPGNSIYNVVNVTGEWNNLTNKYDIPACSRMCSTGYHIENGTTCISNTKTVVCTESGAPDNSIYITGDTQIIWSGTWDTGEWTQAENCSWSCNSGYHTEDNLTCIGNMQQVPCTQTGEIPVNSVYNVVNVTGIWNSGTNSYDAPNCSWMCKFGYTGNNNSCVYDSNATWNNDNFLDHYFRSRNPSDEDIIDALYGSEGDTTAYTLGWPSTCTGMSVVHIVTSDGLPTTLSANTIYVLDTDTIIKDEQINMSNCSAIVSSLENKTTFYSSTKISEDYLMNSSKLNCILDNLNIDGGGNGNGGTHSYNTAVGIVLSGGTYNTMNNISVYKFSNPGINIKNQSNYNKFNNITTYNDGQRVTRGPGIIINSSSNNLLSNIISYNNRDAGIQPYDGATNNVICNAELYDNGRFGVFFGDTATNNILINLNSHDNIYVDSTHSYSGIYYGMTESYRNYYYGSFINENGNRLQLYQIRPDSTDCDVDITYNITGSTDQNVTATLSGCSNVINNNGSNTYEFTENGSFTFEYVGESAFSFDFNDMINYCVGITTGVGMMTATVDWIRTYQIRFLDGYDLLSSARVESGSKARGVIPSNPEKTGLFFGGWYESGASKAFDFNTNITQDLDLYARWTDDEFVTISFETDGGTEKESVEVKVGTKAIYDAYKYSHTQNITDSGEKQSNYGNNWNNSHIRGTDRTSASSQAHVISIPGTETLNVTIEYGGQGVSYDWASMWIGSCPNYTAVSNYSTALTSKLGGTHGTKSYHVSGDTVTFSFYSNGSSVGDGYGYYAVISGSTYGVGEDPEKTGYFFGGWYESGASQPIDFRRKIITEDMTLYARWLTGLTVTFDIDGGGTVEDQYIPRGTKVQQPSPDPDKTGYVFKGWYEEGASEPFDFNTEITGDTDLHVEWYTGVYITFNTNGGTSIATQKIAMGKTGIRPIDPTKQMNEFSGWYTDAELTQEFDFDTEIDEDITLYAKWNFILDYEDITVCDPNGTGCITIMDRNLGASESGTGCTRTETGTCGYHYQWGNNYGFLPCTSNQCDTFPGGETYNDYATRVNTNGYGPGNRYYSGKYMTYSYNPYDWSNPQNGNLWGGNGDTTNNYRGFTSSNAITGRQGPCPDGYHIPSEGEWSKLVEYWAINYTGAFYDVILSTSSNLSSFINTINQPNDFRQYFKLPYAGNRNYSRVVENMGSNGLYRSSTPNGSNSYGFSINSEGVSHIGPFREAGYSVRCFKDEALVPLPLITFWDGDTKMGSLKMSIIPNTPKKTGYYFDGWYETGSNEEFDFNAEITSDIDLYAKWLTGVYVTFNTNGGTNIKTQLIVQGTKATEPLDPTRQMYSFVGWYTDTEYTQEFDFDTEINEDITLYAKWNLVRYFDDITVCDPNGTGCITIMDRNLGASTAGTGCTFASTGICGYHYQWGNNHGFLPCTSSYCSTFPGGEIYNSTRVFEKGYGPGNRYNSGKYTTYNTSPYDWIYPSDNNLWGGSGDIQANDRGWTSSNTFTGRMGPCPDGYHVPSQGEWSKLVEYWAINYTGAFYDISLTKSSNLSYFSSNTTGLKAFQSYFQIPYGGNRLYSSPSFTNAGSNGYYRSSTPNGSSSYYFNITSNGVGITSTTYREYGYSVRCFKDESSELPLINFWDGDTKIGSIKILITPNIIHKTGYIFKEWNESGSNIAFDFSTQEITQDLDLYAARYTGVYVTFNTNGYTNIPTQLIIQGTKATEPSDPTRQLHTFAGRYRDPEYTQEFDFDTVIYEDTTLYAKCDLARDYGSITICDPYGTGCITMMDRNLGASTAGTGCTRTSTGTCGYHYQWGNNHGFLPCTSNGCYTFPGGETYNSTRINTNGYGPGNRYYSRKYTTYSSSPYDWSNPKNDNLWGGSGDTTNNRGLTSLNTLTGRMGPCPDGYHVPSQGERSSLLEYWASLYTGEGNNLTLSISSNLNSFSSNITGSTDFRNYFQIPYAGYRHYYSSSYPKVFNMGSNGYYRSSTPNGSNAYVFSITSSGVNNSSTYREYGYSVRCFKDDAIEQPLLTFWDGVENVGAGRANSGKVFRPNNPEKSGLNFVGWYESGASDEFDFNSTITEDIDLYAKWTRESGYFAISFETDGGTQKNTVYILSGEKAKFSEVYKYSHTENITDSGEKQSDYGTSWGNSNIRGTDRTGASGNAHVITIPGVSSLQVTIDYGSYDSNYDWASMWVGSYPNYTAYNNYSTALTSRLGGARGTRVYDVSGDTVTFSFRSYSSNYGGTRYGYYAVVKGFTYGAGTDPEKTGYFFGGWYESGSNEPFDFTTETITEDMTLYARWVCDTCHLENGISTGNTKLVACIESGASENSSYITGGVQITWSGSWNSGEWTQIESCPWSCNSGYHTEDNLTCTGNIQQIPCIQTGEIPLNSTYDVVNVTGTWNSGTNSYDAPNCSWMCETNNNTHNQQSTHETNITWDNDNFLDSTFWSQNPSDEDIIHALYGSEGDTTAYTLGWPSTCTGMSVVHVTTSDGLPTTLSANTIYVLDTNKIIKDNQITMSNCSAMISSLGNKTTFYSSTSIDVNYIMINSKSNCILDNINVDGGGNGNGGTHSYNTAVGVVLNGGTYNTINNISVYRFYNPGLQIANSNYNKLNNITTYNDGKQVTRGPGITVSSSSYNYISNFVSYSNRDAGIQPKDGSNHNVFCSGNVYNNGRFGVFFWNSPYNNILINVNSNQSNYGLSSSNYYYGTPSRSSLTLYQVKTGSVGKCSINYETTNQGVLATLVGCQATNNNGSNTYLFTQTGSFTFEYTGESDFTFNFDDMIDYCIGGVSTGIITATVDRIGNNNANSYHTEDHLSCTLNTKEVECIQEGKPDHSVYITGDVQITWRGTWNSGEWTQAENCAYSCDIGYELSQNGDCKKANVQVTFIANPSTFSDGRFSGEVTSKTLEYFFTTGGYYAAKTEEIQIPQNPHEQDSSGNLLTGWMFEGWYLDTGYSAASRWTGLSEDTTYTGITLYARYLPFKDKTVTRDGVTFTIMDRNLGALDYSSGYSYDNEQSNESLPDGTRIRIGNYYQWGNNFGFPNNNKYKNTGTNSVSNYLDIVRGPGNYYFNGMFVTNNSIYSEQNENMWGGSGETQDNANSDIDKQGPCPIGYHIPSTYEWISTVNLYNKWKNTAEGVSYCKSIPIGDQFCMPATLGLPFDGYLGSNTAGLASLNTARFWSANLNINYRAHAYDFGFRTGVLLPQYNDNMGYGLTIRCLRNTPDLVLIFDSKGGSNIESKTGFKRWNPLTIDSSKPANPSRTGYTFSGWYRDTGYTDEFIFSGDTYISEDTTLYAKWDLNGYSITYYLDGGTNNSNNPSAYTYESGLITLLSPSRSGYDFGGRTGSNGNIPEKVVNIPANSTGDRVYYAVWNLIPQILFVDPTPVQDSVITQNRFTTKMNITNVDYIKNFEYEYNGTKYDLMSGLVLMYNFDNVESLGESGTVVKDLSNNGNDGVVYGATWTGNGIYGGAYSFDGVDDYIQFTNLSLQDYSIVLRAKSSDGPWTQLVITTGSTYINGVNSGISNIRVDAENGYIGRFGTSYYGGLIDEVRIYDHGLTQDEIQFLYKSNMKKTSQDTWEFERLNTCLDASGTYNYTGTVRSFVDTQASTGRKLTTEIQQLNVNSLGYNFGNYDSIGQAREVTGTMNSLSIVDYLGNHNWMVYFTMSPNLVGDIMGKTIDTDNVQFKANGLSYSGLYEGISNTHVHLGNGVSTGEYNTAKGNSGDSIMEYLVRTGASNDFMCLDVGVYSDSPQIKLEIPEYTFPDTYQGTLWITLQQN